MSRVSPGVLSIIGVSVAEVIGRAERGSGKTFRSDAVLFGNAVAGSVYFCGGSAIRAPRLAMVRLQGWLVRRRHEHEVAQERNERGPLMHA